MFKSQIRFYGKHAIYLKKYSKPTSAKDKIDLPLTVLGQKIEDAYIFETLLQCYMTAAMLGIINRKKAEPDNDPDMHATIMADVLYRNTPNLKRIVQFMILSDEESDLTIDGKIKKAFSAFNNDDKEVENELNAYVRGGLEIIDNYFKEVQNVEDLINQVDKLFDDNEIM